MSYRVKHVSDRYGGYFTGMNHYAAKALGFKFPQSKNTVTVVSKLTKAEREDIDIPTHEKKEATKAKPLFRKLMKPPKSLSLEDQLEVGIEIELEHTNDRTVARKIALDHLKEYSDYYSRLVEMENKAEAEKIYVKSHAETLYEMGDAGSLREGVKDGEKMVRIAHKANGRLN